MRSGSSVMIRKLTQKEIDAFFAKLSGSAAPPPAPGDDDIGYEPTPDETKLCKQLVALGILESVPALPPPVLRSADPEQEDRWMLYDVLSRTKVLACFDSESGEFPAPYGELMHESFIPLAWFLGRVVAGVGRKVEAGKCTYKIALATSDAGVVTSFTNGSDMYDVRSLALLWNHLFEMKGSPKRLFEIEAEDQTALVLCATPKAATALARKFNLELR
jgi:hypothetical protein